MVTCHPHRPFERLAFEHDRSISRDWELVAFQFLKLLLQQGADPDAVQQAIGTLSNEALQTVVRRIQEAVAGQSNIRRSDVILDRPDQATSRLKD